MRRERGWRNSGGGAVANHALWEELIGAVKRHRSVRFEWTKGHDGTEGNEHAHRLASQARRVAEGVDTLSRDRWEEHRGSRCSRLLAGGLSGWKGRCCRERLVRTKRGP